jgi:hypothetical protein
VGAPIIVDGRLWGLAAVGSKQRRPMPADTEAGCKPSAAGSGYTAHPAPAPPCTQNSH